MTYPRFFAADFDRRRLACEMMQQEGWGLWHVLPQSGQCLLAHELSRLAP